MSLIADALKKAQAAKIGRRYLTADTLSVAAEPSHASSMAGVGERPGGQSPTGSILSRFNPSTTLWVGLGSGIALFALLFAYFFSEGAARVKPTSTASPRVERKDLVLAPPPKLPAPEPSPLEKKESSLAEKLLVPTEGERRISEPGAEPGITVKAVEGRKEAKPEAEAGAGEVSKKGEGAGGPELATDLAEQVRYHFNLALFYQEARNFPQAKREYEKALQMWPFYAEAHNNLGVVYKELGRYDQAIATVQKALALNPKYIMAYHNLGAIYQFKGDLKRARKNYEMALSLDRDHLASYNNLALVLKDTRQLHEGRELLEKALAIDPSYPQTHYNLALVLEDLGELERARFHYQKFLELAGDENRHLAARVRARLQEPVVRK